MRLIGIDENGYGPILGPLVVTAASVKFTKNCRVSIHRGRGGPDKSGPYINDNRLPDLWQLLGLKKTPGRSPFVCDSKKVFNTTRLREESGEDMVLAFFYLSAGFIPETADRFLSEILFNRASNLPFPCRNPACHSEPGAKNLIRTPFCWETEIDLKLDSKRRSRILKSADKIKKKTDAAGVVLERPAGLLFCPRLFNDSLQNNRSKSELVVESGLKLILPYAASGQFEACLGKVGAGRYYRPLIQETFGADFDVTTSEEEKEASVYRLARRGEDVGSITYLQDGEDASFLISLASLFGKYTRELFWKKTRVYLEKFLPPGGEHPAQFLPPGGGGSRRDKSGAPLGSPAEKVRRVTEAGFARQVEGKPASGYRDSRTKKFIACTEKLRQKLAIPDDCFLRRK